MSSIGDFAISTSNRPPREANSKIVSDVYDVSEEQEQRIRELVHEGMSERLAREAVLGKGWVEP
jgi:hypothetical protein